MKDDNLYVDLYHVEHPEQEHLAERVHRADLAEGNHWHWTLGLSPLEQFFVMLAFITLLVIMLSVLYGIIRF